MNPIVTTNKTVVFVIVQDYGHFAYTTHLAQVLHNKGYAIEYWSHLSAQQQCPKYASFNRLTSAQSFTNFYCLESSGGDDDLENITRMSSNINNLVESAFPDENPLINISGEPERINALKTRLLQLDVVLCVNDKCHLFAWAGEHCEKYKVPTLNLCPSQHEIQRAHAGVLTQWQQIFANLSSWPPPPPEQVYEPILRDWGESGQQEEVPQVPGLYVTFKPLIADQSLIPAGRVVAGPVYMASEAMEEQVAQLRDSGVHTWLDNDQDSRPVVYVSLGSMIRNFSTVPGDELGARSCSSGGVETGIRALFKALLRPPLAATCRVLTTIPRDVYQDLVGGESNDVYFSSWLPQFAVLGHPRVRAFVSHCGANSVHEAIFHAVPVVAVPFFDDQRYNGPRLVELGLASASLSKEHMTEEQVVVAVREALDSAIIRENMNVASEEARGADGLGRLVAEAERLIDFSIRHPHLKSE